MLWRRLAATLADMLLLGGVGVVLCALFFERFVRMGAWARLVGFAIALAYATMLDGRGGTLGKRLFSGPSRAGLAPRSSRADPSRISRVIPSLMEGRVDLSVLAELKRRRVFRVLVGYGIVAFGVLQIIDPRYTALLKKMNLPPD